MYDTFFVSTEKKRIYYVFRTEAVSPLSLGSQAWASGVHCPSD